LVLLRLRQPRSGVSGNILAAGGQSGQLQRRAGEPQSEPERPMNRGHAMGAENTRFALVGGLTGAVAVLGWLVARDGGWHWWECTVRFNRFYADSSNFGLSGLWFWLGRFGKDWWILFLLLPALLIGRSRRLWFWMGLFLAAWVTTAMSRYGHYYIVVMPFWALLAVAGIDRLASWTASRLERACPCACGLCSRAGLSRLFTAAAVVLLCLPDARFVFTSKARLAQDTPDVLAGSSVVAARIAAMTSAQEGVFVAGSEPQILYYADRCSPTRFAIMYPLMMPTPLAEGYQREAVRDLEQSPPKTIVFVQPGSSWLRHKESPTYFLAYLNMILTQRYELVGGYVTDERGGRWAEPLAEKELPAACLRLYRLKTSH
jgi:hypothetical protein